MSLTNIVSYPIVLENETESAAYLSTAWNFEGYVKYSPLFYGYYSGVQKFDSGYRMPLAYLLANLATFAYSFIAILKQIASNAKDEKASDKDDNFTFSWKTFANWDYMIGNSETAKNKFKSILVGIRESITEQKEAKKKISKKLKFLRVMANFMVMIVLGASTYAISLTVKRSKAIEQRIKESGPDSATFWEKNEISIVMALVTSIFPILFDLIASLEAYHPRVALQWSLYRLLTLYLLNLYTLYIALYGKIQDIQETAMEQNQTFYENTNLTGISFCSEEGSSQELLNVTKESNLSTSDCVERFVPETTCWETMIGQELFKLTVFDMVTTIAMIYGSEFFKAVLIKVCNACWCWDLERNFPGYATFSLAENLLHLVYNQGMVWMGTLFSPGLPVFNLLKLLLLFYVRAWSVMVCNVPEERIFKAGSSNFYLLILLFMLYVVMVPTAFAMVTIKTSQICGPFSKIDFMYLALTNWMDEVLPASANNVFAYASSPGALIPIFILLFLILYYLKSNNDALKGAVLDLKKQLNYERTEGKKRVFSMADEAARPKSSKEKPNHSGTSFTALKAVHQMGAFKNQTLNDETTTNVNTNMVSNENDRPVSLGAALATTRFLAKMKQRRNVRDAAAKTNETDNV